jgi:hypothetical protein
MAMSNAWAASEGRRWCPRTSGRSSQSSIRKGSPPVSHPAWLLTKRPLLNRERESLGKISRPVGRFARHTALSRHQPSAEDRRQLRRKSFGRNGKTQNAGATLASALVVNPGVG